MRITRPFVLLALAALLAPRIEASRTSVWESNPPAAVSVARPDAAAAHASLAPAAAADDEGAEPARFDLGDVALVESELEHEVRFGLGPLELLGPAPLRGPPSSYPETRVRGFELLPPFRVGASPTLSLWSRKACGFSCLGIVSDGPQDPWGLYSPAGIGQKIRSFLAPLRKKAEAAWNALPPVAQVGWTLLSQQNPALFPTPQSAVANVENTLAKPFEIGDKTGTLYGEGASGWEIAASVGDDVSTTITTGMTVATLGSSAAVAGAKAVAPAAGARLESALSAPLSGQGQRFYHYTDDAGGAGLGQPPNRINPSQPETMFAVNEQGTFDAGLNMDRSMTENVFLTDVPPGKIAAHAKRLLPVDRTYTHSVEIGAKEITGQGFRLFKNPVFENTFNVPCPSGLGPCVNPANIKKLPTPVKN